MKAVNKKIYMIPETETLSLGSVYALMSGSGNQSGPGGTGSSDDNHDQINFDPAPGRRVVF